MRITFSELSKITGIPIKSLYAYASPSKNFRIIRDSDKMFDTDIIKNQEFLDHALAKKEQKIKEEATAEGKESAVVEKEVDVGELRRSELGKNANKIIKKARDKKVVIKVDSSPKKAKEEKKAPPTKEEKEREAKRKKEREEHNDFEKKKKKLELEKLQKDNRLKDLEIERKEGDYIKTEDAMSIVRDWSIAKDRLLLELLEKEITYICSREAIPTERAGKYKMKVTELINQASEEATKQMKKL